LAPRTSKVASAACAQPLANIIIMNGGRYDMSGRRVRSA
jgi:hypothetical protein